MRAAELILAAICAIAVIGMLSLAVSLAVKIHQRGSCIERAEWSIGGDASFVSGTYCSRWDK